MRDVYYINLERRKAIAAFQSLHPKNVVTEDDRKKAVQRASSNVLWIARDEEIMEFLPDTRLTPKKMPELILLGRGTHPRNEIIRQFFRKLIYQDDIHLPLEQFVKVIASQNRADLLIGGDVDFDDKVIVFYRGDFSPLLVPFSAFPKSGNGTEPDFTHFSIEDHGQTIRFGDYESSTEAILYEYDLEFRKRHRKNLVQTEKGLGASIRRLRLQKGLRQCDIGGIDEKEIRRIESGEVKNPHSKTLQKLADAFGVQPSDLGSF